MRYLKTYIVFEESTLLSKSIDNVSDDEIKDLFLTITDAGGNVTISRDSRITIHISNKSKTYLTSINIDIKEELQSVLNYLIDHYGLEMDNITCEYTTGFGSGSNKSLRRYDSIERISTRRLSRILLNFK